MVKFTVPILEVTLDTDKPGQSAWRAVFAVVGTAGLFAIVAAGRWLYQRGRDTAGVPEGQAEVPGL